MYRGLQGGCVCRCTITRRLHVKSSLDGLCQFSFFSFKIKCRCCQCIISHHLVRKLQNPLGSWVAHVLNRFGFMSLTLQYCCELCCSGFCILICPWCISSSTPFSQLFCWKVNICFLFELFPHFIYDFWLLYLPQELLPQKRNSVPTCLDVVIFCKLGIVPTYSDELNYRSKNTAKFEKSKLSKWCTVCLSPV